MAPSEKIAPDDHCPEALGLGACVPSGFADIFPTASLRPLSTLPGLEHL
ncbi:hypothetical protein ACWEKR_24220 [Nocardia sp. NPDC004573]